MISFLKKGSDRKDYRRTIQQLEGTIDVIKIIKVLIMIAALTALTIVLLLFSACGKVGQDKDHGVGMAGQGTAEGSQISQTSQTSQISQISQSSKTAPGGSIDESLNGSPGHPSDGSTAEKTAEPEKSPTQPENWEYGEDAENDEVAVADLIGEMSLDEKIGQLFIIGFEGTVLDNALKELILQKHIGGVILFKRNIKDAEQLIALNNSIKEINSNNKTPLFVSVDEEGGRVSRMPDQVKKLPSGKTIGEINSSSLSYEVGSLLALKTKAFGFNMDFAPVLDIWSNPQNTVIGDRAFGTTPEAVLENGIPLMNGIRDGGVIPVVKHFPGHGDTIVDSHFGLPAVDYDVERLESFEWVPFQSAIENQADVVMIAHILMTKIDPVNPASLSKILITEVLRDRMGFDGVVITDDMTMDAIEENYSTGEAAVKSVLAGSDILLVCHGHEKQLEVIKTVKAAVSDGLISEERLDESVYRILKLKQKYRLTDKPTTMIDVEDINKRLEDLDKKFEAHPAK